MMLIQIGLITHEQINYHLNCSQLCRISDKRVNPDELCRDEKIGAEIERIKQSGLFA